jgi:N-carbamoylputrescine amidase
MHTPSKFTVGLVQMSMTDHPSENLQRALSLVEQAAGSGAQIICLPELFVSQYFCQREDPALFDLAEPIPGPSTEALGGLARARRVTIIASLFERRAAGITTPLR